MAIPLNPRSVAVSCYLDSERKPKGVTFSSYPPESDGQGSAKAVQHQHEQYRVTLSPNLMRSKGEHLENHTDEQDKESDGVVDSDEFTNFYKRTLGEAIFNDPIKCINKKAPSVSKAMEQKFLESYYKPFSKMESHCIPVSKKESYCKPVSKKESYCIPVSKKESHSRLVSREEFRYRPGSREEFRYRPVSWEEFCYRPVLRENDEKTIEMSLKSGGKHTNETEMKEEGGNPLFEHGKQKRLFTKNLASNRREHGDNSRETVVADKGCNMNLSRTTMVNRVHEFRRKYTRELSDSRREHEKNSTETADIETECKVNTSQTVNRVHENDHKTDSGEDITHGDKMQDSKMGFESNEKDRPMFGNRGSNNTRSTLFQTAGIPSTPTDYLTNLPKQSKSITSCRYRNVFTTDIPRSPSSKRDVKSVADSPTRRIHRLPTCLPNTFGEWCHSQCRCGMVPHSCHYFHPCRWAGRRYSNNHPGYRPCHSRRRADAKKPTNTGRRASDTMIFNYQGEASRASSRSRVKTPSKERTSYTNNFIFVCEPQCLPGILKALANKAGVVEESLKVENMTQTSCFAGILNNVHRREDVAGISSAVQRREDVAGVPNAVQRREDVAGISSAVQKREDVAGVPNAVQRREDVAGISSAVQRREDGTRTLYAGDLEAFNAEEKRCGPNMDERKSDEMVPENVVRTIEITSRSRPKKQSGDKKSKRYKKGSDDCKHRKLPRSRRISVNEWLTG